MTNILCLIHHDWDEVFSDVKPYIPIGKRCLRCSKEVSYKSKIWYSKDKTYALVTIWVPGKGAITANSKGDIVRLTKTKG